MDRIYEAKKYYYGAGSDKLSDDEYDHLECSFKAIHGEECFKELYCVGYDKDMHDNIKKKLLRADIQSLQAHKLDGIGVPELESKIAEYIKKYGEIIQNKPLL